MYVNEVDCEFWPYWPALHVSWSMTLYVQTAMQYQASFWGGRRLAWEQGYRSHHGHLVACVASSFLVSLGEIVMVCRYMATVQEWILWLQFLHSEKINITFSTASNTTWGAKKPMCVASTFLGKCASITAVDLIQRNKLCSWKFF